MSRTRTRFHRLLFARCGFRAAVRQGKEKASVTKPVGWDSEANREVAWSVSHERS